MVAPDAEAAAQSQPENTGTFGKLKQTLSSSLLTAQDKGEKSFVYKMWYKSLYQVLYKVFDDYCCLTIRMFNLRSQSTRFESE